MAVDRATGGSRPPTVRCAASAGLLSPTGAALTKSCSVCSWACGVGCSAGLKPWCREGHAIGQSLCLCVWLVTVRAWQFPVYKPSQVGPCLSTAEVMTQRQSRSGGSWVKEGLPGRRIERHVLGSVYATSSQE